MSILKKMPILMSICIDNINAKIKVDSYDSLPR